MVPFDQLKKGADLSAQIHPRELAHRLPSSLPYRRASAWTVDPDPRWRQWSRTCRHSTRQDIRSVSSPPTSLPFARLTISLLAVEKSLLPLVPTTRLSLLRSTVPPKESITRLRTSPPRFVFAFSLSFSSSSYLLPLLTRTSFIDSQSHRQCRRQCRRRLCRPKLLGEERRLACSRWKDGPPRSHVGSSHREAPQHGSYSVQEAED